MISVSSALAAALAATRCAPRTLVEIDAIDGTYRYATEALRWSGRHYQGRLLNAGPMTTTIVGADAGVRQRISASIELSDADGLLRRKPPFAWRGRPVRILQVLTDVDSEAVRTTALRITACRGTATSWTLDCDDTISAYGQSYLPSPANEVTPSQYPELAATTAGYVPPLLYGRQYAPLKLVDQSSTADVYVACVGCATLNGFVCTLEEFGLSPLTYPYSTGRYPMTAPYTVQYMRRGGAVMTEIVVDRGAAWNPVLLFGTPLYADLTGPLGANVTPPQVLSDLLTQAGLTATTELDSATFWAAHSACVAASHYVEAALIPPQPLETWVEQLLHDGMLRVLPGASLRLQYLGSLTPVASVSPAAIVPGTIRISDLPLGSDRSDRTVSYLDRITGTAISSGAISRTRWVAASGIAVAEFCPFIGRGLVAQRVVQTYAEIEAAGIRRYDLTTGAQGALLEPGDPITFTFTPAGAAGLRCEVLQVQPAWPVTHMTLRPQPVTVFGGIGGTADRTSFAPLFQRVPYYGPNTYVPIDPSDPLVWTGSHQLTATPRYARMLTLYPGLLRLVSDSLVTATGSTFSIAFRLTGVAGGVSTAETAVLWFRGADLFT